MCMLIMTENKTVSEFGFVPKLLLDTVNLPLPKNLPAGNFRIQVAILNAQTNRKELEQETEFRVPELKKYSQYKFDRDIPPPWTPIKKTGDGVYEVWGRRYEMGAGPFPKQIFSQAIPLLTRPITLTIDVNGQLSSIEWNDFKVTEEAPDMVSFSGRGRLSKYSELNISWTGSLYFDGVYVFKFVLEPKNEIKLGSMKMNYSLCKEASRFVLTPLLVPWKQDRIELDFKPIEANLTDFSVWVTGHDVGLFWWPESDANWVPAPGGQKPVTIVRNKQGEAEVEIGIVNGAAKLAQKAPYTMVLMGSPARRPPERFRNFFQGLPGTTKVNCFVSGWNSQRDALSPDDTDASNLIPRDIKEFRGYMKFWNNKNVPIVLPYGQPTQMPSVHSEYDYFGKTWECVPGRLCGPTGSKGGIKYVSYAVCGNSDFAIFMDMNVKNLVEKCPEIGGIYYDLCWPSYCQNTEHGCGGQDAFGRPIHTSTALGLRRILLQNYKILHKTGKILFNHNHSYFNPIAHNFSDYWFPGEQYTTKIADNPEYFYSENIKPEVYQTELNWKIRGVGINFLPEYTRAQAYLPHLKKYNFYDEKYAVRTIAPLILHDIQINNANINLVPLAQIWEVIIRTDLSAAEFVGYWQNTEIKPDNDKIKISYYKWPQKGLHKILIVIANLTREPLTTDIKIDSNKLNLKKVTVEEMLNQNKEKPISMISSELKNITVEGGGYRVIGIQEEP